MTADDLKLNDVLRQSGEEVPTQATLHVPKREGPHDARVQGKNLAVGRKNHLPGRFRHTARANQ